MHSWVLAPYSLEPYRRGAGIAGGMAGIAMAEIILDQAQIAACMGERMAAGMAQHMRMDRPEAGPPGDRGNEIVDGLAGQRLATFREKQPRHSILPHRQDTPQGAELVSGQGLVSGKTAFQPPDPDVSGCEVEIGAPEHDQLADPQPVAVHQQQHEVIARAMPAGFRRRQQPRHLGRSQIIPAAPMRIDRLGAVTLDKRPVGVRIAHVLSALQLLGSASSILNKMHFL